jgi:pyruvate formate lyase activating enzyme
MQPDFVADLFERCHALGLTTCLDTTGQASTLGGPGGMQAAWDTVLPHTDMVLFCVKHLDPGKYHDITGLQQQHAMAFAEQLKQRRIKFWLRYVLLPGYTDAPEDIRALIGFCREQPTLQGVELLPYHLLGKNKWAELGLPYPLEGVQPPGQEAVLAVVDQLEAAGLAVVCDAKEPRGQQAQAL